MALRQEDPQMDPERAKEIATFRDSQLERAVDALKGVMIYADKRGGAKPAAAAN
jgi:hypothetical protein